MSEDADGPSHRETRPSQRRASAAASPTADRRPGPKRPKVGWIATIAILMMLIMGAGWELWRWLLLMIGAN